ncbi:hypothetical protein SAMN04489806_1050 [Paramicrobacterium humi]|uniref:Uncharacterized protein n=1 Tax=Paramicrobacterium humi TaxID=640635 RepID=A0A1H4K7R3_9MICO|nr:hypothetical protein [Microbacterium humi]SEB54463.1 hypothetical protein SAMN04489806_1050 [Microbacterium humi]
MIVVTTPIEAGKPVAVMLDVKVLDETELDGSSVKARVVETLDCGCIGGSRFPKRKISIHLCLSIATDRFLALDRKLRLRNTEFGCLDVTSVRRRRRRADPVQKR